MKKLLVSFYNFNPFDSIKNYDILNVKILKDICNKRLIKYNDNINKSSLVEKLINYDNNKINEFINLCNIDEF